ncbi:MAG: helix-turn-helix transcriptional regulator [Lachnospiraceae bacterium]|jgi:AraC-like DNA-binding protein|nr:helix-turn-helix transcriptional regulator [Lachnospiraceae bacterium]
MIVGEKAIEDWMNLQNFIEKEHNIHITLIDNFTNQIYRNSYDNNFCECIKSALFNTPAIDCCLLYKQKDKHYQDLDYFEETCPLGLTHLIFPIKFNDMCVLTLHFTHFKRETTKCSFNNSYFSLNKNSLAKSLYNNIPSFSEKKIKHLTKVGIFLSTLILPSILKSEYLEHFANETINFNDYIEKCDLYTSITLLLNFNYKHIYTLDELSESLHYHKNTICNVIKKETHMPFSKFYDNLKVNSAKKLLISTNKTTIEIAEFLGYSTPEILYKKFKNSTGLTMSEYRKIH